MVLEWIANPSVGVIRLPSSSLGLSAKIRKSGTQSFRQNLTKVKYETR